LASHMTELRLCGETIKVVVAVANRRANDETGFRD